MTEASKETIYKQLSNDMRDGLRDIYQQISNASRDQEGSNDNAQLLFQEATNQLQEVIETTEKATMTIIEIVERDLNLQAELADAIAAVRADGASEDSLARLDDLNNKIGDDLTNLMTSMSFQDLTGQRIKKVVNALQKIEKSVVDLYVSSGLIMDGVEKDPAKDASALKDEASKALDDFHNNRQVKSELKGPDKNGASQAAIDDMLAQLGL